MEAHIDVVMWDVEYGPKVKHNNKYALCYYTKPTWVFYQFLNPGNHILSQKKQAQKLAVKNTPDSLRPETELVHTTSTIVELNMCVFNK